MKKQLLMILLTASIDEFQIPDFLETLKKGVGKSKIVRIEALPKAAPEILTPRQRQILGEIAIGKSIKEIAHKLGISPKTVETHRDKLVKRLGIRPIPALVRYALQSGLLSANWLMRPAVRKSHPTA